MTQSPYSHGAAFSRVLLYLGLVLQYFREEYGVRMATSFLMSSHYFKYFPFLITIHHPVESSLKHCFIEG